MPVDWKDYPPDWEQIALRVKEAAGWVCVQCGRPCRRPGETIQAFCERLMLDAYENDEEGLALPYVEGEIIPEAKAYPQRFTLTCHHPDHDKSNPNARLEVLCSGCHLRADAQHHATNAAATRRRKREQRQPSLLPDTGGGG